MLVLDKAAQSFVFTGVAERPVLSTNRNFSAPIRLTANLSADDLRLMAARDSDPFNRWQAVQTLASALLVGNVARLRAGQDPEVDEGLLDALAAILADKTLEPAFVAEALSPPSEADIAREIGRDVDPDAIFRARAALRALIGLHLNAALTVDLSEPGRQRPLQPGRRQRRPAPAQERLPRSARGDAGVARHSPGGEAVSGGRQHDRPHGGAGTLSLHDVPERKAAFDDFYRRYRDDPLIIDKWFALQAMTPDPATLDRVRALTEHPAFSMANPNRVRSLIGAFAQGNPTQFNRPDGAGYEFVADTILALDPNNPQVAARMTTAFKSWRALERGRRAPRAGGAAADRGGAEAVARRRRHRRSARLLNPEVAEFRPRHRSRVQRVETTPEFASCQNAPRRFLLRR